MNLSKRSHRLTPSTPRPTSQRIKLTVKTRNLRREKQPPWEEDILNISPSLRNTLYTLSNEVIIKSQC